MKLLYLNFGLIIFFASFGFFEANASNFHSIIFKNGQKTFWIPLVREYRCANNQIVDGTNHLKMNFKSPIKIDRLKSKEFIHYKGGFYKKIPKLPKLKWEKIQGGIPFDKLKLNYNKNLHNDGFIELRLINVKEKKIEEEGCLKFIQYYGKVAIDQRSNLSQNNSKNDSKKVYVSENIPETVSSQPHTYALIIGNQNYTKYQNSLTREQNVPFAKRDARIFAKYCWKTLGIPEDNIRLDTNVTKGQMQRHIDWLVKLSKYGGPNTKLIFYYSGHGFPDQETKKKYLMPVDIAGGQVTEGIHVNSLYDKLLKHDPKRATVFLDACFSGAGRGNKGLLAAKGVKVKPKENAIRDGNLVAFSSSKGDQRSWFYREKKHGLFTYFLMKKLQQTKGRVTYGALEAYLTKKVPIKSITTHNSEQVPQVNYSREIEGEWQDWRLR